MKVIDLIGLIINNETIPKHIIFEEEEYCWNSSANDYICNDHDATRLFNNQYNMSNLLSFLGKRVEILEEDTPTQNQRIERLNLLGEMNLPSVFFKVNEIIDYLNYNKSN